MNKKQPKSSPVSVGVALMVGVIDLLLVIVLALCFLIQPVSSKAVASELSEDFEDNSESYYEIDSAGEYVQEETVSYTTGTGVVTQTAGSTESETDTGEEEQDVETLAMEETDTDSDSIYAGFIFPDSNTAVLTDSQISASITSADACQRAINEIYARHGYQFTYQENLDFFNSYTWYQSMTKITDMDMVSSMFSSVERTNVEKLEAYGQENGWR